MRSTNWCSSRLVGARSPAEMFLVFRVRLFYNLDNRCWHRGSRNFVVSSLSSCAVHLTVELGETGLSEGNTWVASGELQNLSNYEESRDILNLEELALFKTYNSYSNIFPLIAVHKRQNLVLLRSLFCVNWKFDGDDDITNNVSLNTLHADELQEFVESLKTKEREFRFALWIFTWPHPYGWPTNGKHTLLPVPLYFSWRLLWIIASFLL